MSVKLTGHFTLRSAQLGICILATTILCAAFSSSGATAQNLDSNPTGFDFQVLMPLSAGLCNRPGPEVAEWTGYARQIELRDAAFRGVERGVIRDAAGMPPRRARHGGAAYAGHSNGTSCSIASVGLSTDSGPASFPGAEDGFASGDDIGMFSLQSLAGFGGKNLKLKLSSRSVKVRFRLRF